MKMQNFFKTIFILIRLKFLFIILLSGFSAFASIQTEWNITSEKESPVPSYKYKSCQNLEAKQKPLDKSSSQKESSLREDLTERISFQIKTKQLYIQKIKKCFESDNQTQIYNDCQKLKEEITKASEESLPIMRVLLSLSAPAIKEHRLLAHVTTWLDPTPSHIIPSFSSLSPLSEKELEKAKTIYLKGIRQIAFNDEITLEELKKRIKSHSLFSPEFTPQEEDRIRSAVSELRRISKQGYLEILQSMPFLAYLEDEKSLKDNKSLGYVFSVIDQELNDLLQKLDEPKTDMGFLLSFAPIVEGVLSESPEYCLEAEAERVKSERRGFKKVFYEGSGGGVMGCPYNWSC